MSELRGCYVAFGRLDAAQRARLLRALYALPGVERVQLGPDPAELAATAGELAGLFDRVLQLLGTVRRDAA
jgi:hypothetical protein